MKLFKIRQILTSIILLLVTICDIGAQVQFSGRIETGYQHYLFRTITVDPGPDWKGYNLNEKQSGFNITSINGLTYGKKKLFAGIGLGYLNFEGFGGVSIFGDIEYLQSKNKISPLFDFRFGYGHLWNQYEGGKGTMHTEIGLGINCKYKEKSAFYIKSGLLKTQQSLLLPVTVGFRY
jgi:hypothetical protein